MSAWDEWKKREGKGIVFIGLFAILAGFFLDLLRLIGAFGEAHIAIALSYGARNGGLIVMAAGGLKMLAERWRR